MSTSKGARLRAVGLLVVSLGACSAATFEPSSGDLSQQASRVEASSVLVLESPPSTTYQDLGTISLQWKGKPDDEAVLRLVRKKAAQVGANAVLFVDRRNYVESGFQHHWGGAAEDGPISMRRTTHENYTFRAVRIP